MIVFIAQAKEMSLHSRTVVSQSPTLFSATQVKESEISLCNVLIYFSLSPTDCKLQESKNLA